MPPGTLVILSGFANLSEMPAPRTLARVLFRAFCVHFDVHDVDIPTVGFRLANWHRDSFGVGCIDDDFVLLGCD